MDLDNTELGIVRTHLSAMRNSIITISLGIAIYGVSQSLKNKPKLFLEIVSVLIYYFSFSFLYTNNQMFNHFSALANGFLKVVLLLIYTFDFQYFTLICFHNSFSLNYFSIWSFNWSSQSPSKTLAQLSTISHNGIKDNWLFFIPEND